jgi:hypothetical protein
MADIIMKNKRLNKRFSVEEIDATVIAQADDESVWEEPVYVHRAKSASVSIPAELAARADFLARAHKAKGVDEWLRRIIQERIELEEVAFAEAKKDLAAKNKS